METNTLNQEPKATTPEQMDLKNGEWVEERRIFWRSHGADQNQKSEKSPSASGKPEDEKSTEKKEGEKEPEGKKEDQKKEKFKFTPKKIAGMVVLALVLFGGLFYFLHQRHTYESTDDAMVQAHFTLLAPKVSGIVTQVLVEENQKVSAGEVLVRVETKDYSAELKSMRANFESTQAQYQSAQKDYARAGLLVKEHAITRQDYDHAIADYHELQSKLASAQAEVDQSRLNLAYTEILAPTDGTIGRKSVEVGMNDSDGSPVLGFVQNDDRWIIANFKETQLSEVLPGRKVKVEVDAISDHDFEGVVESISPSSGATFTLFPPDNATGNFTKVVQRVPVKIYLKNLTPYDIKRLQNGLSAVASVYKHKEIETIPPHAYLNYTSQLSQSLPESLPEQQAQKKGPFRAPEGESVGSKH